MSAHALIARLDRVKQTGPGRWIAPCPAHKDRNPSLSVRELEDGRTLVHCFAGCEVQAVVESIGLTVVDLFPPRPASDHRTEPRRGFSPMDVLHCLAHESRVVLIVARTLAGGERLIPDDVSRLALAVGRIGAAVEVSHA